MITKNENLMEAEKKKYRFLEIEVLTWENKDILSVSFDTDSGVVDSEIEIPDIDDDWFLG